MAKYTVTITNISSIEVDAASSDEACRKIDKALGYGDASMMEMIREASTGWEITDWEITADDEQE